MVGKQNFAMASSRRVELRPQVPPMYRGDIYGVNFRVDSISEVKMTIKPSFEAVQTMRYRWALQTIVIMTYCSISL